MKYSYQITIHKTFFIIDEIQTNKNGNDYKLSWTNNQIFGQGSVLVSEKLKNSVKRCKKWLIKNRPELII